MTAAMVIECNDSRDVEVYKGILNETLVAQWLKFADVSEKSVSNMEKVLLNLLIQIA